MIFQPRRNGLYLVKGEAWRLEEPAVDRTVARLNVEHYRKLLANETDETRRQTIARLLAEEEAKLARLENLSKQQKPMP